MGSTSYRTQLEPPGGGFDAHYDLNNALYILAWLEIWNLVLILWLTAVEHFQRELFIVPVYASLILVLQPVFSAACCYSLLCVLLALGSVLVGITGSATYWGILLSRYNSCDSLDPLCADTDTRTGFSWLIALSATALLLWVLLAVVLCKALYIIHSHWACCYCHYIDPDSYRFVAPPARSYHSPSAQAGCDRIKEWKL